MGGENHVINERFPVGAELVLSDESPGAGIVDMYRSFHRRRTADDLAHLL
jgi:hypothetical protein